MVKNEIDIKELRERIGVVNSLNLNNFTSFVRNGMLDEYKILCGMYVIGSNTYPEKYFKKYSPTKDIDIIIAPCHKYKKLLKPSKDNDVSCEFAQMLESFLNKYGQNIKGIVKKNIKFDIIEIQSRKTRFVDYGRPNDEIEFKDKKSKPLHLIVQYFSPASYENVSKRLKDQVSYEESIANERKENKPFCLI